MTSAIIDAIFILISILFPIQFVATFSNASSEKPFNFYDWMTEIYYLSTFLNANLTSESHSESSDFGSDEYS